MISSCHFPEELVDREKRAKLWEIYWGKTVANSNQSHGAELTRIRNIKKQLAMINRNQIIMNDTFVSPVINRPILSDGHSVVLPNTVIHV